ncbi:GbsR/MarR family transcriptional regulator [Actinomadura hibisca]|uniref:GbsR/MarR family transcriptional regulator n=1 Tax=Actinomadura hibisca TaxID=68565 RepID=UPI00082A4A6A|nr:MarR family transcriptional regulator [Actinomadura hibisca]
MPGERLDHADRRTIAEGLAERLGYAEIARRLGRPTSTVSREVTRNGGPDAYRPDHAHQAAAWRARRPKTPASPSDDDHESAEVHAFAERFAGLMVHTGLPKMAARVLACLITVDAASLTAADLVARLRVSPASVSKAIAYLEGLEIVRRERDRRRERYVIDADAWERVWATNARVHARWAATAREGVALFDPATPAGGRLARMAEFFAHLSDYTTTDLTDPAIGDALTVVAALAHASRPLTATQLSAVLGLPAERVTAALDYAVERHPDMIDPIAVHRPGPGTYAIAGSRNRLTDAQRVALDGLP